MDTLRGAKSRLSPDLECSSTNASLFYTDHTTVNNTSLQSSHNLILAHGAPLCFENHCVQHTDYVLCMEQLGRCDAYARAPCSKDRDIKELAMQLSSTLNAARQLVL